MIIWACPLLFLQMFWQTSADHPYIQIATNGNVCVEKTSKKWPRRCEHGDIDNNACKSACNQWGYCIGYSLYTPDLSFVLHCLLYNSNETIQCPSDYKLMDYQEPPVVVTSIAQFAGKSPSWGASGTGCYGKLTEYEGYKIVQYKTNCEPSRFIAGYDVKSTIDLCTDEKDCKGVKIRKCSSSGCRCDGKTNGLEVLRCQELDENTTNIGCDGVTYLKQTTSTTKLTTLMTLSATQSTATSGNSTASIAAYAVIGVTTGTGTLVAVVCIFIFCYCRRNKKRKVTKLKQGVDNPLAQLEQLSIKLDPLRILKITDIIEGNITLPDESEFEILVKMDAKRYQNSKTVQGRRYNSAENGCLNRYPNVLPYDSNRVVLVNKIQGLDYINASLLNPKKDDDATYEYARMTPYFPYRNLAVVVAQTPMSYTMFHHLQMLQEQRIDVLVNINRPDSFPINQNVCEECNVKRYFHIDVKTVKKQVISPVLSQSRIQLHHTLLKTTHNVKLFNLRDWPTDEPIDEKDIIKDLITAICLIRRLIGKGKDHLNICIQDQEAGCSGASIFILLYQLMDNVDEAILCARGQLEMSSGFHTTVNIFQTVDKARQKRAKMICNANEYRFLFKCVTYYAQNRAHLDSLQVDDQANYDSDDADDRNFYTAEEIRRHTCSCCRADDDNYVHWEDLPR